MRLGGPMNFDAGVVPSSQRAPKPVYGRRLPSLSAMLSILALGLLTRATMTRAFSVPVDQLAKPPATAQKFTILSTAGTHGKAFIWTGEDGSRMARESILLRGQVWEVDQKVVIGKDGMPSSWVVRGITPQGDAGESFQVDGSKASWKSPVDSGTGSYAPGTFYLSDGGPNSGGNQLLLEALLTSPGKSLPLLPGGQARVERLTELSVGQGDTKKTVTAWAVFGLAPSPVPMWTTADGKFFGTINGLGILPVGYEGDLVAMEKAQDDALAARSPVLFKTLLKTPKGAVAFTHVRAFLDGSHFADDQTVVVENGLIASVGPSAADQLMPESTQVIDGTGMTLVPGLWDSHQHVSDDSSGPFLLALGITSVRDPGNINELTLARADRRAKGNLLSPKVYPSMLIDGKGPNSAQVGTVVTSLDEAIAAVRKAKAEGFTGIKIYGSYNPAWVAPGGGGKHTAWTSRVHGHVPAEMRPSSYCMQRVTMS